MLPGGEGEGCVTDPIVAHDTPRARHACGSVTTPCVCSGVALVFRLLRTGHDVLSMVFNYLDELLYLFGSDAIVVKDIKIVHYNPATFSLTAWWYDTVAAAMTTTAVLVVVVVCGCPS